MLDEQLLAEFPGAEPLMAAVEALDGVKEYLAARSTLTGVGTDPKLGGATTGFAP
jgi:hypothetical protein